MNWEVCCSIKWFYTMIISFIWMTTRNLKCVFLLDLFILRTLSIEHGTKGKPSCMRSIFKQWCTGVCGVVSYRHCCDSVAGTGPLGRVPRTVAAVVTWCEVARPQVLCCFYATGWQKTLVRVSLYWSSPVQRGLLSVPYCLIVPVRWETACCMK